MPVSTSLQTISDPGLADPVQTTGGSYTATVLHSDITGKVIFRYSLSLNIFMDYPNENVYKTHTVGALKIVNRANYMHHYL